MSSTTKSRNWDPNIMYDVTPDEQRAMKERAARRAQLKAEWQMKVTNPHRGVQGYIFDPAIQRYLSMRANHWESFKVTPKSARFGFLWGAFPILLLWYYIDKDIKTRDAKFRSGTVPYRDRNWKFIN